MKRILLTLVTVVAAKAAPVIINDAKLIASLEDKAGEFAEAGEVPTPKELEAELKERTATMPEGFDRSVLAEVSCEEPTDAVYLLGSVFDCGKCDRWHLSGVATAWALSSDGLMVTNYHVIDGATGGAMGVCDRNGNTYPVIEVLAADKPSDVAIIRVDATGIPALAVGAPAEVGSSVHVISHPFRRFFMHTYGEVSRYFQSPKRGDRAGAVRMSITADYAKGSSGGPVLNEADEVVGVVSSTQSIYYGSKNGKPDGPLQMVVKNCVPVRALRDILGLDES